MLICKNWKCCQHVTAVIVRILQPVLFSCLYIFLVLQSVVHRFDIKRTVFNNVVSTACHCFKLPPISLSATSSWVQPDPPLHSPPPVSVAMQMHSGHKRTPSEAERWLEEVSKAVKAQQTPPSGPTIPTIPGPPSMSNQQLPSQAAISAASVSTVSITLSTMSKPLISGPTALSGQPPMPLPPMSISSVPLIPGDRKSVV